VSTVDTNNKLADPELLPSICAYVAEGGTLTAYCNENSLHYRLVNRWIHDDETRAKRYKLALDVREQHAKDLIIAELIAYIKADVTQCFDAEGNMLRMPDMGANEKRLIAGVKFREIFEMEGKGEERARVHVGNIIEVKFWDKPRSIETFMKHLSMLVERKEIDARLSLADLITGEKGAKG